MSMAKSAYDVMPLSVSRQREELWSRSFVTRTTTPNEMFRVASPVTRSKEIEIYTLGFLIPADSARRHQGRLSKSQSQNRAGCPMNSI